MRLLLPRLALFLCLGLPASISLAHPLHGLAAIDGILHPITGLDHLLAMLGVGLWAALQTGRTRWLVPGVFVGAMAVAAWIGAYGQQSLLVEWGITMSVLLTGILLFFSVRASTLAAVLVVGTFAAFHGYAHGVEMPHAAGAWTFGAGFLLTTMLLQGIGFWVGVRSKAHQAMIRTGGAGIAICGGLLAFRALL